MDNWENCSGYKILTQKTELDKKFMDERFDALKKHSDKRDDIIETKLDNINNFLQNGFTDKIIKTIESYFDRLIANVVKWLLRIGVAAAIITIAGLVLSKIFQ